MFYFKGVTFSTPDILFALLFLMVVMQVIYYYQKKQHPSDYYYRDIPPLPVAMISYYDKGKINSKTIWLTLLDFIGKGYYTIQKLDEDYVLTWNKGNPWRLDDFSLTDYEIILMKFLNSLLKDNKVTLKELKQQISLNDNSKKMLQRFYDGFHAELKKGYGHVSKESNYVLTILMMIGYFVIVFKKPFLLMFGVNSIAIILFGILYAFICFGLSLVIRNLKFNMKSIIGIIILFLIILFVSLPVLPTVFAGKNPLLFALLLFNPLIIIDGVLILNTNFYTKKQKELAKNIFGLKNFLEHFSKLEDRPLDYVELFDRYYVVAEALDVKLTKNPYQKTEFDDDSLETLDAFEFAEIVMQILSS